VPGGWEGWVLFWTTWRIGADVLNAERSDRGTPPKITGERGAIAGPSVPPPGRSRATLSD